MKNELAIVHRLKLAAGGLLLCSCLLFAASAGAQNLLKNGNFETPQGATNTVANWTLGFLWGGPGDFEILDRGATVRGGSANYWSLGIRPNHEKWAHAYFSQTVTNLQPGHAYAFSGWMVQERWKGITEAFREQYLVYIEAIGGQGTPTPDGRAYVLAATQTQTDTLGPPCYYPSTTWLQFTNTQTPAANGSIEIRLHMSKIAWCEADKMATMFGHFDDVTLTY